MTDLSLFSVSGKKALVTGAASGLGRACAMALAKAGADVAIVDFNEAMGNKVADSISATGVESFCLPCDVSDESQVQTMMTEIITRFGRLDIAVNSAGVCDQPDGVEQQKQDWDRVIGINLTGVWLCARAEAQQMIGQTPMGGKIINIASAAATTASLHTAYCAAKAGVAHLTRSLAMGLGANNINVNSISPGVFMSPMTAASSVEFRNRLRSITPMGYIARSQDIAGALLFLASSASDFITGQDLLMDGGRTLTNWELPERQTPPRLSVEDELLQVKTDLDELGIPYDDEGVIQTDP